MRGKTLRVHPCRVEGHGQFCEVGREAAHVLSRSQERHEWRQEVDDDLLIDVRFAHEET